MCQETKHQKSITCDNVALCYIRWQPFCSALISISNYSNYTMWKLQPFTPTGLVVFRSAGLITVYSNSVLV